jgi:hypothetical protein
MRKFRHSREGGNPEGLQRARLDSRLRGNDGLAASRAASTLCYSSEYALFHTQNAKKAMGCLLMAFFSFRCLFQSFKTLCRGSGRPPVFDFPAPPPVSVAYGYHGFATCDSITYKTAAVLSTLFSSGGNSGAGMLSPFRFSIRPRVERRRRCCKVSRSTVLRFAESPT